MVDGRVGPGWRIRAGDSLTVTGMVERAELAAATGTLTLEAPCRGGDLQAGSARPTFVQLVKTLDGADNTLFELSFLASELQAKAAVRGKTLTPSEAFRALVEHRVPDLGERLNEAVAVIRAGRSHIGSMSESLLDAVNAARGAFETGVDLSTITASASDLTNALAVARAVPAESGRSVVDAINDCELDCDGDLLVRGAGARDCTIRVRGDLVVGGGALSGGSTRVGGALRAERIGGTGQTQITIGGGRGGERLRAARIGPGVRVEIVGDTLAFPQEQRDVVISVVGGRPEVTSGAK